METESLEVRQLDAEDVFKDIARIHESQRGGLPLGTICKISVGKASRYLSIRGLPAETLERRKLPTQAPNYILLDEVARSDLGLKLQSKYRFKIVPASWCGRVWWACSATDPAARVSALIATWSLALAVIGLVLGVWSVLR